MAKRKTRYDDLMKMLPYIRAKLEEGLPEKRVAEDAGVAWSTWSRVKRQHPEFAAEIKSAREKPAGKVKESMYESAVGYTRKVKRHMKCRRIEYENGRRVLEEEQLVPYEDEVYYPPNVTAGIFLLTNWMPSDYARDAAANRLREREIEIKEKKAAEDDWGEQ